MMIYAIGVQADGPKVRVDQIPADQDSSIIIHKGPLIPGQGLGLPEFQIVESKDEVSGEPVMGRKESYASWKSACAEWKKELKANNGDRLLYSNCGKPSLHKDETTQEITQVSEGTYKLKVSNSPSTTK